MHHRRLACFLLGSWIAGILFVAAIAYHSRFDIDRAMGPVSPGGGTLMQKVGLENTRLLFRYQSMELTRFVIDRWEWLQMALALMLAASLYLSRHVNRIALIVCGIMLLLVLFMHFVLTPEINWIGRSLDFSSDPGGSGRVRFWSLQALYFGLEGLKLLAGLSISVYLFYLRTHRSSATSSSTHSSTRALS